MSLNWDLTKIKNYEEFCWLKNDDDDTVKLNTATEALIWLSMGIGMNRITEANAAEFYSRVSLYEKLNGSMRSVWYDDDRGHQRIFTSEEDVYNHIGLGTNATPYTDAKFRKLMFDCANRDASRAFREYVKELNKEEVA